MSTQNSLPRSSTAPLLRGPTDRRRQRLLGMWNLSPHSDPLKQNLRLPGPGGLKCTVMFEKLYRGFP